MRTHLVGLIITILLPLCALAQGQKLRDRDPDIAAAKQVAASVQQANFHYGSWYLLSRIRIADAGFTEGVYVPTTSEQNAVTLSVEAPQRLYFVPRKKAIFTIDAVPGYTIFGTRESRQFNYSARADAHFLLNHLYLDFYESLSDKIEAHVSDINRLATVRSSEGGVSGEAKYSSRTSALFSVRFGDVKYPRDRFQPDLTLIPVYLLDRTEKSGRVSLMHKTFPLTSLFVAGERSQYDFRTATYKDSTRTWYGGGLIWNTGRAQLRLEGGPIRLEFADPSQPDYNGVTGSMSLNRSNGRWKFGIGADRNLGFSIFRDNNFYVGTSLAASLSYAVTRKLEIRTNAARERDDYDVPVDGILRRDTISFYGVGTSYGISHARFGIDVGWYERLSNILDQSDSGIRYGLTLSITP